MNAGPADIASQYLENNVENAYGWFRMFLYEKGFGLVPNRNSPKMHEELSELLSDKNHPYHSKMIDHILKIFWALDLKVVEEDFNGLKELLGGFSYEAQDAEYYASLQEDSPE